MIFLEFKGKCVVITGAAGKIGRRMVEEFAKRGAYLIILDLNKEALFELKEKLNAIYPHPVITVQVDIRDPEQVKRAFENIRKEVNSVDILINNAGVNNFSPALQITEDIWNNIIDVNLKGAFFVSQQCATAMVAGKGGVIINIASQHGVVGNINRAAYCASKAGLINLTRALSVEWAKFNIRVNSISPTFVHDETDSLNNQYLTSTTIKREFLSKIPLRRYAKPEDVVNATLYLASDMANMITGHNLVIDGGWTAI
ncbi:glucose 1-dehydrogenase [Bacillus mycoides]|uniref:SDR family NAD(P)-dependent oxidoreductase n=1 Tax=Bacillus mycoides TaxID=1405 RepID=UPI001C322E57|nr:glucose 1-dehydrogenase [Bacillus mycoides]QWG69106.1 glucose 1-dehydrogenase [Bacillus mycoides]